MFKGLILGLILSISFSAFFPGNSYSDNRKYSVHEVSLHQIIDLSDEFFVGKLVSKRTEVALDGSYTIYRFCDIKKHSHNKEPNCLERTVKSSRPDGFVPVFNVGITYIFFMNKEIDKYPYWITPFANKGVFFVYEDGVYSYYGERIKSFKNGSYMVKGPRETISEDGLSYYDFMNKVTSLKLNDKESK